MILSNLKRNTAYGLLLFSLALAWPQPVHAATLNSGLTVSPASLNFRLEANSKQQDIPISLSNGTSVPVSITAQFMGIDESGGRLIPTGLPDATLAQSLSVDQTELTIPAGQTQKLNVQFRDSPKLSPGGHYATLVLSQKSTGGQLSLQAAASLTIFATKTSGANPQLVLRTSKLNGWLLKLPDRAELTYASTGNVLVVPRAALTIQSGPKLLANGVANQESLPILPGQQRVVTGQFQHLQNRWLPGKVAITITFRADGVDKLQTIQLSRWYVPPIYPIGLTLLAGLIVWIRQTASGKRFWKRFRASIITLKKRTLERLQRRKARRLKGISEPVTHATSRKITIRTASETGEAVTVVKKAKKKS